MLTSQWHPILTLLLLKIWIAFHWICICSVDYDYVLHIVKAILYTYSRLHWRSCDTVHTSKSLSSPELPVYDEESDEWVDFFSCKYLLQCHLSAGFCFNFSKPNFPNEAYCMFFLFWLFLIVLCSFLHFFLFICWNFTMIQKSILSFITIV
jgi:hypothetical protein